MEAFLLEFAIFCKFLKYQFLFDLFNNKGRKLKVAESEQAKASLTKPWLATDEDKTKFVAIILVLSVFFFNAIFRLTDFSSDAFDFSSSKTGSTGSAQRALSALRAFQLCFTAQTFWRLSNDRSPVVWEQFARR